MSTPDYDSPDQRYSYQSDLVDAMRADDFTCTAGRITFHLARKFGFCWGVDRAVAMIQDAVRDNPGRRIWLLNQIIHNPKVNQDLRDQGVRFVFGPYAEESGFDGIQREDLVVIPAFSTEVEHTMRLAEIGCEQLDTTCPWVEKPHRRVLKYISDGFTTIIHGLIGHEETSATCSLIRSRDAHFVVVRNLDETDQLCAYLRGDLSSEQFSAAFAGKTTDGFDPERDLRKVGVINQTTMLASESKEFARRISAAMVNRDGEVAVADSFRDFDTICPATQDNQDAVMALSADDRPDVFLVLGGYDSSNTKNLLMAAHAKHGKFHVQSGSLSATEIRHRDADSGEEVATRDWLPDGPVRVDLSAGASTPDTEIESLILAVCRAAGVEPPSLATTAS